jgi:hypothetical protein
VVRALRYVIFQMAEVAIARQMFQEILRLIAELRPQPPPALRESCIQEQPTEGVRPNARENGQIRPSTKRSGYRVLVAVSTSRLSCKRAGKTRTLMPVWDSSGESRLNSLATTRKKCCLGASMTSAAPLQWASRTSECSRTSSKPCSITFQVIRQESPEFTIGRFMRLRSVQLWNDGLVISKWRSKGLSQRSWPFRLAVLKTMIPSTRHGGRDSERSDGNARPSAASKRNQAA